jgi:glycosyltransferase involved in cell wall biosynthesis
MWTVLVRDADVRRTQPELRDWARAMVPHVVAARPDVLHAHDYTSLAVALPALEQLRARGVATRLVYDAHEFLPGVLGHDAVWMAAMTRLEERGLAAADEVVTVSEPLAEILRTRHGLRVPVTVVTNAPVVEPLPAGQPGLREVVGVPAPVPLLVYSGGVAPQRGLDTAVEALPALPGVHLALVSGRNRHVEALLRRAGDLGVADRVHVTPYVAPALVSAFVEGATAGLVTSLHLPNHEISLPTKYYEYALAGLPVVVSDIAEVARRTRDLGNGEVYPAGDAAAFAQAARAVLAGHDRYRAGYTPALRASFQWAEQVPGLLEVYRRLTGATPAAPADRAAFGSSPLELAGAGRRVLVR